MDVRWLHHFRYSLGPTGLRANQYPASGKRQFYECQTDNLLIKWPPGALRMHNLLIRSSWDECPLLIYCGLSIQNPHLWGFIAYI
jgi:hypothetical protein